ncbi:MAG: TspO/MBR family protein [Rubrivivax sp.]
MTRGTRTPPPGHAGRVGLWAAVAVMAVAGAGNLGTDLGPWYQALRQPPWKPPDLWFGPAWTLIFGFIAWSGARGWLRADAQMRRRLAWAFGLNGVLNVAWSWIFFRLRRPDWALVEVLPFWLSIVLLVWLLSRIDRVAALLMLPYLCWVAFAAALNAAVVRLNAPG